jgi:hypothetical protein
MKAAKHKPVVLELKPQSARGCSEQTFGAGARGDAEVSEHKVPPSNRQRHPNEAKDG